MSMARGRVACDDNRHHLAALCASQGRLASTTPCQRGCVVVSGGSAFVMMVQTTDFANLNDSCLRREPVFVSVAERLCRATGECASYGNKTHTDVSVRCKERSSKTIIWSRHSRRIEPMSRST